MIKLYRGDCLKILKRLPAGSVNCCVTSPPYWGLRDYGRPDQIGLEATPEIYVSNLVEVFRQVWRVLRDDGTLWLNIGDSYNSQASNQRNDLIGGWSAGMGRSSKNDKTLKPKDLIGIPWRLAFALQADGWFLRSDIIWHKPNPMPESARDRPTKSHEYLFLLAKSERYYFDAAAVAEPSVSGPCDIRKMTEKKNRIGGKHKTLIDPFSKASASTNIGRKRSVGNPGTRNIRSVWTIATSSYKGAHFATFPPRLVQPCVKAGSPIGGTVIDPFAGSGTTARSPANWAETSSVLI